MFGHECPSTFKRLPSNSDDRYSISKPFRRDRVGPLEPPDVEGASRMRVVCIYYPSPLSSAIAGNHVLWRLSHSGKLHRAKNRIGFDLFSFFFVYFLCFSRTSESQFVFFALVVNYVFFPRYFGPTLRSCREKYRTTVVVDSHPYTTIFRLVVLPTCTLHHVVIIKESPHGRGCTFWVKGF